MGETATVSAGVERKVEAAAEVVMRLESVVEAEEAAALDAEEVVPKLTVMVMRTEAEVTSTSTAERAMPRAACAAACRNAILRRAWGARLGRAHLPFA